MPSITSKTILMLEKDKDITVNYELNDWLNISIDGITGWVRKYFVTNYEKVEEPSVQNEEPKQEESESESYEYSSGEEEEM